MESNPIKFRCSSSGLLMTDPRSKSELLSETTKKYLLEVFIKQKYGRRKDISNKYIQKGLQSEEDSITLFSRVTGELYKKNDTLFENDFVKGTPDLIWGTPPNAKLIVDTKTSWDLFTFWDAKTSSLNKNYYWQLQCYMWLTGAKKSKLAYCLVDTPQALIEDEKQKYAWSCQKNGVLMTEEALEEIERNAKYGDIPLAERLHQIEIDYDQDAIESLKLRIEDCRVYMKSTFGI